MKRMLSPMLVISLCVAVGLLAYSYAIGPNEKPSQGHLSAIAEKVNIEVTNTDNGVVVTLTSNDVEVVKVIQNHFSMVQNKGVKACLDKFSCAGPGGCSGGCMEMCGNKKGSEECKKAHESGQCKPHGEGNNEKCKDAHTAGGCSQHGEKQEVAPQKGE